MRLNVWVVALAWLSAGALSCTTTTPEALPEPAIRAATEQSLNGCLTRGPGNAYLLSALDGRTISVTGPAVLARHVHHIVRLEGSLNRTGSVFRASAIESETSDCGR